jgi:enoyl-CoA hydratase/carnithine racemase
MNSAAPVICADRESVRTLTLNRPASLNALSRALAVAFMRALREAAAEPAVAAIIVTGAGDRAFSAGVDLAEAASLSVAEIPSWFGDISGCYREVLLTDKPVLVALNGVAAGGGYQIALVADWRVGCTRTRLLQPEILAGLPSIMGAYLMRFHLPIGINQELSYSGRAVHADECRRLGLLNELTASETLADAAFERAREFARRPDVAFKATKARYRDQILAGFDEARDAAIAGMQASYAAGVAQACMQKFLEGRR